MTDQTQLSADINAQATWETETYGMPASEAADATYDANVQPDFRHALVVVDVQNDFCTGGALAVNDAERRIPFINRLIERFKAAGHPVVLTQDWHPAGHSSFASSHDGAMAFDKISMPYGDQVLWPDHCIQGSPGAEFKAGLDTQAADFLVRKGTNPAVDSYSGLRENDRMTETGLLAYLRERGIDAVHLVGIAGDYCVGWTALDVMDMAREMTAYIYVDGIACIDPGDGWAYMAEQITDAEGIVVDGIKSSNDDDADGDDDAGDDA